MSQNKFLYYVWTIINLHRHSFQSVISMIPGICHLFLSKTASAIALYTSSYNMTALTLERHFAIVDPLGYDPAKVRRRLPLVFLFVWVFCAVALGFVPMSTIYDNNLGICLVTIKLKTTVFWDYISLYVFIIAIAIPLTIMIVCYSRMIHALYTSSRQFNRGGKEQARDINSSSVHKLRMAQMNIFQTCLLMILVFLVCWFTLESALILYMLGYYPHLGVTHYSVGWLFIIINSSVNPYIYAFRYDDFKRQVKVLLGFKVAKTVSELSTQQTSIKRPR